MDLQDIFAKRLQKIDQLNNFISIFDKKKELFDELKSLNENIGDVREILMECSNCISRFQTVNQQRYTELMRRSREQQDKILDLLETMENQQPKFLSPKPHPSSARPALLENVQRMENFMTPVRKQFCDMGETPVMNFSDYIKSPFTSNRKRPISLQFADFERVISPDEFSKIPRLEQRQNCHFGKSIFSCFLPFQLHERPRNSCWDSTISCACDHRLFHRQIPIIAKTTRSCSIDRHRIMEFIQSTRRVFPRWETSFYWLIIIW